MPDNQQISERLTLIDERIQLLDIRVKLLLTNGGKIDALDIKSTPPLVIAAQYDHTILVFYLVRAKVRSSSLPRLFRVSLPRRDTVAFLPPRLGDPNPPLDSTHATPRRTSTCWTTARTLPSTGPPTRATARRSLSSRTSASRSTQRTRTARLRCTWRRCAARPTWSSSCWSPRTRRA